MNLQRIGRPLAAMTGILLAGAMAFGGLPAYAVDAAEVDSVQTSAVDAGYQTITNDSFWNDTDGNPIYSQGGGIFDFEDPETGQIKHYWYGVHYEEAETYRENPTQQVKSNTFKSVDVYSSTDLVNWDHEGEALNREQADSFSKEFDGRKVAWVGRMGVAYVKELKTYALFIQHEMPTDDTGKNFDKEVLIATSSTPAGPFKADRRINMKDYGLGSSNTGDQSVFQDDDGTGYLVYSYGNGRSRQWVAQIGAKDGKVDLLNPTKVYQGEGREGNTMFKVNGKYYFASSDLFGWDSSRIHYLVADNIMGPYTPTNKTIIMDGSREDFGHITQTGFYYTVHGSKQDTVIHAGDRWSDFAGNGLGYNQWNPLTIDADGIPHFNSMNQWSLNATTGEWKVASGNNYVLNGSFEADRVALGENGYNDKDGNNIPDLAGWERTNPAAVKNAGDRAGRVGDFNLEFTAKEAFSAKIEQTIDPARFDFPDGQYSLTAQYMSTKDVKDAKLYAVSDGKTFETNLSASTKGKWTSATVPVTVSGGQATVGISVDGNAGDLLRADDITLTKSDYSTVDKSALRSAITAASTLAEGDYTAESWQDLRSALTQAKAVVNDTEASQEEVNSAQTALEIAVEALVSSNLLANYGFENGTAEPWNAQGNSKTIRVQKKNPHTGAYSWNSWTSDTQDYTLSQQVMVPAGYYAASVWTAGNTDKNDDIKLSLKSGDSELASKKVVIKNNPDNPKDVVWGKTTTDQVLVNAGDAALVAADADNLVPLTVELSVKADANAWFAFDDFALTKVGDIAPEPEPVDKTSLVSAIESANKLVEKDYTDDSWAALKTALDAANAVNGDENATQEMVGKAAEDLKAAVDALVKVSPTPTPPSGGNGGGAVTPSEPEVVVPPSSVDVSFGGQLDLSGLKVDFGDGKTVGAEGVTVSGYDASKPGKQTVTLTSKEDPSKKVSIEVLVMFKDVDETTPHHEEIKTILRRGITRGFADGTFHGMSTLKRQDLAAFLYRLAGQPDYEPVEEDFVFADVTVDTPHYREILWAAKRGVIQGYAAADGTRTFAGGADIKRQDMIAMLYRLAGSPELKDGASFSDVTADTPHREAIAWAKSVGVTTGFADGTFRGGNTIIRQDTAAFLGRMIDKDLVAK